MSDLASFEAANGGTTTNGGDVVDPEAGDNIFIYSGSYTGPLTLEDSQRIGDLRLPAVADGFAARVTALI